MWQVGLKGVLGMVYSSVYGLCVVDEYAALHIHASVHALSMFVSGGGWRPRRETAGHIDSARDTRPIPHKKRTPLFFFGAAQKLSLIHISEPTRPY